MTIACTRCGATEEGNIISAPIAFAFKHDLGCGHGVGPLSVLPASYKSKQKEEFKKEETKIFDEVKEIKVESKKSKSKKEKTKVFG